MSESSQSTVPLVQLTGPMLIGLCLNWGLFGCSMVQVYYYHCFFPKDGWRFKTFVYILYLWDFAQTLVFTQDWFNIFAQNFGSQNALEMIGTTWFSVPFMNGLSSPIIQCFYAWRVYNLSKSYILCGIIVLVALVGAAGSIALGVIMGFKISAFSQLHAKSASVTIVWLVGSATCDIIIAGCMIYYLNKARVRSPYRATGNMLQRLIRITLGAGLATALCSLTDITLYLAFPLTNYHMAPAVIIGKLYINSFFVLVNSRRRHQSPEGVSVYAWDSEIDPTVMEQDVTPRRMSIASRRISAVSRRVSLPLDTLGARIAQPDSLRTSEFDYGLAQSPTSMLGKFKRDDPV